MENRFGFKDFILIVLLLGLIVSVWLAIKQYDRQWDQLAQIRSSLDEQRRDILDIQRQLAAGVAVASSGQSPATRPSDDPFQRVRAAMAVPGYAPGGALVDAFGNSVGQLTPLLSSDAYASIVQGYVLETLCQRDPDTLEWQPLLCTRWRVTDHIAEREAAIEKLKAEGNSEEQIAADDSVPPAIEVLFTLRPGVKFSDGTPLTVEDILFTYQWIMNPQVNAPRARAYYSRISRVEKVGEDQVRFLFNEPYYAAFELAASMEILPKHFYGRYAPEQFNQAVGLLLGSGPYQMDNPTTWRPGTLISLTRNDRYWGVGGAFERLVWREITNDAAHLAAFRNGDIDVFPAQPEQYAQMIREPAMLQRAYHFEYQNPIGGYSFIAWNQSLGNKPTFFADVRVRQAMTMLIDRQRLIQQIRLGYAVQATGPFNPLSKQYNPDVTVWPYSPQQAMTLLKQAGYADRNADGVIESPTGEPFRFKLTYPSGAASYEKMVLFLKDAYARAGIILEPDPLDWSVLVERLNKKNFQAVTLGWTAGIETDIFQMFHSSQTIAEGDNFINYRSAELDAIIDRARRTVDEPVRMRLWREAHRIIHEEQPYTFLFFPKTLVFVDKKIRNVQTVKLGLNPRTEWFIPLAQRRTP